MRRPTRRVTVAAVFAILAVAVFAAVALAQSNDKLRTGQTVTIPAGETVASDLYVFAGTVRVEGTVDGDLVATGGTIDVPGTVTGDVLAAGGNISIGGSVGGDARVAGGSLSLGSVGEDLAAAGGQVTLSPSGTVGEDMLASAGRLSVDGSVTGDLTASAGQYDKTGKVGGTEDCVSRRQARSRSTAPEQTTTSLVIDAIQHFLVVLLVGALLIWLAPRAYAATKEAIQRQLPAGRRLGPTRTVRLHRRGARDPACDDRPGDRVRHRRVR